MKPSCHGWVEWTPPSTGTYQFEVTNASCSMVLWLNGTDSSSVPCIINIGTVCWSVWRAGLALMVWFVHSVSFPWDSQPSNPVTAVSFISFKLVGPNQSMAAVMFASGVTASMDARCPPALDPHATIVCASRLYNSAFSWIQSRAVFRSSNWAGQIASLESRYSTLTTAQNPSSTICCVAWLTPINRFPCNHPPPWIHIITGWGPSLSGR